MSSVDRPRQIGIAEIVRVLAKLLRPNIFGRKAIEHQRFGDLGKGVEGTAELGRDRAVKSDGRRATRSSREMARRLE